MNERDLSLWLQRLMANEELKNELILESIETGWKTQSIPDFYFAARRSAGWLELKMIRSSLKPVVHFEPGQLRWLTRHSRLGKRSLLLTCFEDLGEQLVSIHEGNCVQEKWESWQDYRTSAVLHAPKVLITSRDIMKIIDC